MRKKKIVLALLVSAVLILALIAGITVIMRTSNISNEDIQKDVIDTVYQVNINNIQTDEESGISFVNNIVLIFFDDDVDQEIKNNIIRSIGGIVVGELKTINQCQVQVESKTLSELRKTCETLEKYEGVILATYDKVYYNPEASVITPKDPWIQGFMQELHINNKYEKVKWSESAPGENNWWAEAIQLPSTWSYNDYFSDITIGVIDAGFDTEHEDLKGKITFPSAAYEVVNSYNNHGTHVAGIIGAIPNNGKGITGIVWKSELICVDWYPSVFENWVTGKERAWSTDLVLMAGLVETVKAGAKIVNFSIQLSNSLESDDCVYSAETINEAAELASTYMGALLTRGYDFVVVQSSGNGAANSIGVDAINNGTFCAITVENCVDKYKGIVNDILDRIIIVGSVGLFDNEYKQAKSSNGGTQVDIVAPGEQVYSCISQSRYKSESGTSFAAPIVTGVASLVWSIDPSFTGAEVKAMVCDERSTSEPIPDNPKSPNATGDFRMVNAYKAVKLAIEKSQEKKEKEKIRAQKIEAIMGTYKGSYMAQQGETALTLTIYKDSTDYKARFDFGSLLGRNNASKGSYHMDVSYDFDTDSYNFKATKWIDKPEWYDLLNLNGTYNNGVISGKSPTQFKVTRVDKYTEHAVYLDRLIGTYQGTYNFSLWVDAGMLIDVYRDGDAYKAKCNFYKLSEQSTVISGSFIYNVSYSELNGYYMFEGDKWIERPAFYSMPTLYGRLKDDILFGTETLRFELKRIDTTEAAEAIKNAMEAYFQVAILGYDSLLDAVDAGTIKKKDMISNEVRHTMLQAAPEHAWRNLYYAKGCTLDEILSQYIGLYRNYVWGNYVYNVGEDYEITYEIISMSVLSVQEIADLDAQISKLSSISGQDMDTITEEQRKYQEYTPVIEPGALEDAYNFIVKYTASGSKRNWIRNGQYTAIKTNGQWYILKDGYYQIFWDNTITEGVSGNWHT